MKLCKECDIEMIEDTNLHTNIVGGISFEDQIYLSYKNGTTKSKNLFGKEKEKDNYVAKRVKARVCPQCGKVELFVDTISAD